MGFLPRVRVFWRGCWRCSNVQACLLCPHAQSCLHIISGVDESKRKERFKVVRVSHIRCGALSRHLNILLANKLDLRVCIQAKHIYTNKVKDPIGYAFLSVSLLPEHCPGCSPGDTWVWLRASPTRIIKFLVVEIHLYLSADSRSAHFICFSITMFQSIYIVKPQAI